MSETAAPRTIGEVGLDPHRGCVGYLSKLVSRHEEQREVCFSLRQTVARDEAQPEEHKKGPAQVRVLQAPRLTPSSSTAQGRRW